MYSWSYRDVVSFTCRAGEAHEDSSSAITCSECLHTLPDAELVWRIAGDFVCESCGDEVLAEIEVEARAYARKHCRLTSAPHVFDPSCEYRCSPEEYELGIRESYTENSVLARNRHWRTNYDTLIRKLDKSATNARDALYYRAIRERVEELIRDAVLSAAGADG